MKNISLALILIGILGLISLCCEKENDSLNSLYVYYWTNNEKIILKKDTSSYILCFLGQYDIQNIKDILYSDFNVIEANEIIIDSREYLIAKGGSINVLARNQGEIQEIDYMMPLYYYKNSIRIYLNEIVLKPKDGITIEQIIEFTSNQVTLQSESGYDTFILTPNDPIKLFDINNQIYNSDLVIFCEPNYVFDIE